jgi:stage V sporulation protein R
MDEVGVEEVEEFIDACLSLEDQIDIHSPFIRRREEKSRYDFAEDDKREKEIPPRFRAKDYMDSFINPRDKLAAAAKELDEKRREPKAFPERPERDVLLFLLEHAPLNSWQSDVLSIIRDEAYYFAPQGQTKIMNEGWASYWHSTIMTRQGLSAADVVNYCDHHSGTLASSPTQLNPYKLGIELFRDIEDRWNRGAFGKEYDDCDDYRTRREWNTDAGRGREKIFEVRRIHNDLTFIDEFLTLDFVRDQKLFKFGYNESTEYYEIETREFPKVKRQLLASLTNMGRPQIAVLDGNYKNRGELYLQHTYSGVELQLDYAKDTLLNLQKLWNRPVHLETVLEDSRTVLSFDGADHHFEKGEPLELAEGAHI